MLQTLACARVVCAAPAGKYKGTTSGSDGATGSAGSMEARLLRRLVPTVSFANGTVLNLNLTQRASTRVRALGQY